ncbi:MAG TPA: AMP-binding protein, partial [Longimicrobiaceae bacterium]|nr:AMP-binding protein [Longimicrobiaceae bacterium]
GPLTHFFPWLKRTFGLVESDRFSMLSALAHDPLQRDIFTPLMLGATLCVPPPEALEAPGRLALWMREEGITVSNLTPAMGRLLADAPPGGAVPGLPSLRRAFFAGDVLTRADVAALRALAPRVTVVNRYGATETQRAIGCFVIDADGGDGFPDETSREAEPLPLGRGIPGVQLLVLNSARRLAGVGELGEIHVRTPHLARGYLDDPVLTAERFVRNPFTGREDDRVYRTGDLGRYRPDGDVEPLGRADQQVKIRGFRIEPGEIEAVLREHPAVRRALVVAREDVPGEKRLVAYLVPEGEAPAVPELLRSLRERLPPYMVPSSFVALDAFPLTPNGKLDRRALPAPPSVRPAEDAYVAPRGPVEEVLAATWAEVLGVERVGAYDHFFELGGHSLAAMRLLARMRGVLGVELLLRAVFEAPTVAGLAERVEEARRTRPARPLPPLVRAGRAGPLPLSPAQQRLWFLHRLGDGGAAYHLPSAFRLAGALDVDALERALAEVVRRHEALRTVFAEREGEPEQVVAPAA